jgi:hypothetical protein
MEQLLGTGPDAQYNRNQRSMAHKAKPSACTRNVPGYGLSRAGAVDCSWTGMEEIQVNQINPRSPAGGGPPWLGFSGLGAGKQ